MDLFWFQQQAGKKELEGPVIQVYGGQMEAQEVVQGPICMLIVLIVIVEELVDLMDLLEHRQLQADMKEKGKALQQKNLEPVRYMLVEEEQEAQQHITARRKLIQLLLPEQEERAVEEQEEQQVLVEILEPPELVAAEEVADIIMQEWAEAVGPVMSL